MKQDQDLYKTLNIAKNATPEEIQKAYKKLAFKYHPNRHGNKTEQEKTDLTKQFQEIHKAYTILSDPKKRDAYDRFGVTDNQDHANFNVNDIFTNLFGSTGGSNMNGGGNGSAFSFFSSMGGNGGGNFMDFDFANQDGNDFMNQGHPNFFSSSNKAQRGKTCANVVVKKDTEHNLQCTLEEYFCGAKKKLKINSKVLNGGVGISNIITVDILPGYKKGTRIKYEKMGDEYSKGMFGDFVVVLDEKEEDIKREGDDLVCEVMYEYEDFINGGKKTLKLPGNRVATIKGNLVDIIGGFLIVKNYGMIKRKSGNYGDLKVRIMVKNNKTIN